MVEQMHTHTFQKIRAQVFPMRLDQLALYVCGLQEIDRRKTQNDFYESGEYHRLRYAAQKAIAEELREFQRQAIADDIRKRDALTTAPVCKFGFCLYLVFIISTMAERARVNYSNRKRYWSRHTHYKMKVGERRFRRKNRLALEALA